MKDDLYMLQGTLQIVDHVGRDVEPERLVREERQRRSITIRSLVEEARIQFTPIGLATKLVDEQVRLLPLPAPGQIEFAGDDHGRERTPDGRDDLLRIIAAGDNPQASSALITLAFSVPVSLPSSPW